MHRADLIRNPGRAVVSCRLRGTLLLLACFAGPLWGAPPLHPRYRSDLPPGEIGFEQLRRGPSRQGYVQPIEIKVPTGATVAIACDGDFPWSANSLQVGLQIGQVYRLRVTDIPRHNGGEVYPSVELIDRLYPPEGQKLRFPIPIEITQEDLESALSGRMVVRVIYLENPLLAYPRREDPQEQRFQDALAGEDPLQVADELGRPVAILRMGSLVPAASPPDAAFLFGSPSVVSYTSDCAVQPAGFAACLTHSPTGPAPLSIAEAAEPSVCCPASPDVEQWRPDGIAGPWPPDEYLCDGGDDATRVVVSRQRQVSGLDAEDTVAHFDTLDGTTAVTPSNSVCIYAPRFAVVRQSAEPQQEGLLERTQFIEQPLPAVTDEARQLAGTVLLPDAPVREVSIRGPRALWDPRRGIMLDSPLRLAELVADFKAYEDFQIIRIGIDSTPEKPRLAEHILAAIQWSHDLSPEILLDEQPAIVEKTIEKTGVVYRLDEPDNPRLRLIKVASTPAARPGEEVEFTLRYDNLGDQTLQRVTILDHLTTRLEYVPDSAQSDRKADFTCQLNAGESLTLRWELAEPLRPGNGGVLRFKCRVR